MASVFDIEYGKGNKIPHEDVLSRLRFYKESKAETEELEDTFLHWVETDVLSGEARQDPVLSRITSRIRKKYVGKLFQGGKTL